MSKLQERQLWTVQQRLTTIHWPEASGEAAMPDPLTSLSLNFARSGLEERLTGFELPRVVTEILS